MPVSITTATLDSSFRPAVKFNYFGANHTGYNIQFEKVDGTPLSAKLPATLELISPNARHAAYANARLPFKPGIAASS